MAYVPEDSCWFEIAEICFDAECFLPRGPHRDCWYFLLLAYSDALPRG